MEKNLLKSDSVLLLSIREISALDEPTRLDRGFQTAERHRKENREKESIGTCSPCSINNHGKKKCGEDNDNANNEKNKAEKSTIFLVIMLINSDHVRFICYGAHAHYQS